MARVTRCGGFSVQGAGFMLRNVGLQWGLGLRKFRNQPESLNPQVSALDPKLLIMTNHSCGVPPPRPHHIPGGK
jgi:hypothetical protein